MTPKPSPQTLPKPVPKPSSNAPRTTPQTTPHTHPYTTYMSGGPLAGPRRDTSLGRLKGSNGLRFWQLSCPHARARSNFPPRRRPPEWDSQACQGCAPSAILSLVLCVSQPRR